MTARYSLVAAATAALLGAAASAPAQAQQDPAFGMWLRATGTSIIKIEPCGQRACGRLVWLRDKTDANGQPRMDSENPDPAKRNRRLCGIAIMWGFERTSAGNWENGKIYKADEGDVYDSYIEIQDDGRLKLRGYLGVSLLGKSEILTRVDNSRGGC